MLKLKIGGVPEHFNLPWKLAIEESRFREKNIYLHWEDIAGGTGQMIRGLENGSIDIAVLLTEGITKAILDGLDAKIIQVYVTTPLRWGIHVPKNSGIQKKEDLINGTFAISRSGCMLGSSRTRFDTCTMNGRLTRPLRYEQAKMQQVGCGGVLQKMLMCRPPPSASHHQSALQFLSPSWWACLQMQRLGTICEKYAI